MNGITVPWVIEGFDATLVGGHLDGVVMRRADDAGQEEIDRTKGCGRKHKEEDRKVRVQSSTPPRGAILTYLRRREATTADFGVSSK